MRSAPRQAPADAPGASEPDPLRKRRRGVVVLAAALAVVVASAVALLVRPAPSATSGRVPQQPAVGSVTASAEPSRGTDPGAPATTVPAGERSGRPPAADRSIRLAGSTVPTKPFQAAQIQGTYTGGANTLLQVERWEEGRWRAFPVPTKTDQSGAFVAYVELGRRGRYPLRVLDPRAGLRSDPVVLVVED